MSDLISRKLAIELLQNTIAMTKKEERRRNYCVELIKAMPSAQPTAEPVRHGKWVFNPSDAIEAMFTNPKCSECGFESADGRNYCPNCGARMDKE